jgi:hypothetical protein
MADVDPANIPLLDDEPQQPLQRDIKLPPFWTSRPRAWFMYVESRFRLRRITDDQQMFDHVLSALCFFHWTFADKATKCVAPCTWGN